MADWGYTYMTCEEDRLWLDEGLRNGWWLPEAAPAWLRLWGIRHIRWWWIVTKANHDFRHFENEPGSWETLWRREWVAYAVARGWV